MNPDVDAFINRSQQWPDEMRALRMVLLGTGLTEELKWRQPAYTHVGKNIAIMGEMKAALTLGFFKGTLLADPDGHLKDNGPNSRSVRRMYFTSVDEVERLATAVSQFVAEAIKVEEAGLTVGPAPQPVLVAELQTRIDSDKAFKSAFESLTPGRQREYNLYFSGAKQASTRESRIAKYADKILNGKGLRDR